MIGDTSGALGGAEAILDANILLLGGTGQTYRLGPQPNPDADDIHADGMLLVYLPREQVLIEGDPFTPGARVAPWAANLLVKIQDLSINVSRFAPVHGDIAPFSELERAVGALESDTGN